MYFSILVQSKKDFIFIRTKYVKSHQQSKTSLLLQEIFRLLEFVNWKNKNVGGYL